MAEQLRVHVLVEHPRMRLFLNDMLVREYGCEVVSVAGEGPAQAAARFRPGDVVLVDQWVFAAEEWAAAATRARARTVVIGPEDDPSSRDAAADMGADAWIAREHLGDGLGRAILGALEPRPRRSAEGVA